MVHCLRAPVSEIAAALVLGVALLAASGRAEEASPAGAAVADQNRQLQEQVRAQQRTIDDLKAKLNQVLRTTERQERTLRELEDKIDGAAAAPATAPDREHEVRVAGEAGVAFFNTGADGPFPKAEFRVDDPVISVEAPVWKQVYVFGELKLLTREANNDNFQLGEFYVDFEDVLQTWGRPGWLGFRAGRINTPFGEEYQVRTPVSNPLISHSLSDIWGTDEGLEIYGGADGIHYVVAVQNGGVSRLHDYNADKAVVGRLTWEPLPWLKVSGSAMRTGELSPSGDTLSDLWFANSFFRSIGSTTGTTAFWVDLAEADAQARWKSGHIGVAWGGIRYDDNDRAANNARRLRYGYIEMVQNLADNLYGAARYSEIHAPGGYPMAGSGTAGEYFFRPSLTDSLRRISVGLGYRLGPPIVVKVEYSWNSGKLASGQPRNEEDFFGTELGVKF